MGAKKVKSEPLFGGQPVTAECAKETYAKKDLETQTEIVFT